MNKPVLLDLFCGAGGAAKGYADAGFDVVGMDIKSQPHYPFVMQKWDISQFTLEDLKSLDWVDAIHASPPCQRYSVMTKGRWKDREHPDLIEFTRKLLQASGKPYIIENVVGAPLIDPIMLCGTMFGRETPEGAQLRRHRLFETSFPVTDVPKCNHNDGSAIGVYGGGQHPNRRMAASVAVYGHGGGYSHRDQVQQWGVEARRQVMGIPWMSGKELSESIPPCYTFFLGTQLMSYLGLNSE